MKLHFAASTHADSQSRLAQLTKLYGQFDVEVADFIVVLGGDGQMLQAMRDSIPVSYTHLTLPTSVPV